MSSGSERKDMASDNAKGPLSGIRVLEIANVIAGPTTGQVLGDYGAEIIKIEHPEGGDPSRRQGMPKEGKPLWWKTMARNKRSVGMYLGDPEAAEIFLKLVATADVVLENFRTGTLEKWNLGYDRMKAVNPGIILARLTGFGQTGPYAKRPAFGTMIEGMSGMADLIGERDGPPMLPVFALGDYVAGYSLVSAIMMALYHRDARGGGGQVIDACLLHPLMSILSRQIIHWDQLRFKESRVGNRSTSAAPRNAYLTKDKKWVVFTAATTKLAARVLDLVGAPDFAKEEWFQSNAGRVAHVEELDAPVKAWVAARTRDEVLAQAEQAQVTFAPINDVPDMMEDPHVQATRMIVDVPDRDFGKVKMPNVIFRFSETPGSIRWTGPELGSSTDAVLIDELGIGRDEIARLRERGVVL